MAHRASWHLSYPSESSRPQQAGVHGRFPQSLFLRALGLGQYAFGFLLPAEYFFYIHSRFFHHLRIKNYAQNQKEPENDGFPILFISVTGKSFSSGKAEYPFYNSEAAAAGFPNQAWIADGHPGSI